MLRVRDCFCYATDDGYLLPTLVSSSQLKRFSDGTFQSVVVIYFYTNPAAVAPATAFCREHGIKLVATRKDVLDELSMYFSRFFIDQYLCHEYRYLYYLDGDTQIAGSVLDLGKLELTAGNIAATLDPVSLAMTSNLKSASRLRKYFDSIGLPPDARYRYFNSGFIAGRRSDWGEISRECLRIARSSGTRYRFPDQDIINIVLSGAISQLSMRWNFPAFLMGSEFEAAVRPAIYHFMSNPRPWHGPFRPWGSEWSQPYRDLIDSHEHFAYLLKTPPVAVTLKYHLQQWVKRLHFDREWFHPSTIQAVTAHEQQAIG